MQGRQIEDNYYPLPTTNYQQQTKNKKNKKNKSQKKKKTNKNII